MFETKAGAVSLRIKITFPIGRVVKTVEALLSHILQTSLLFYSIEELLVNEEASQKTVHVLGGCWNTTDEGKLRLSDRIAFSVSCVFQAVDQGINEQIWKLDQAFVSLERGSARLFRLTRDGFHFTPFEEEIAELLGTNGGSQKN